MRRKQTVRQLKEGKTWPRKHLIQPWIPHIKHQAHLVRILHESQVSLAPGYKCTGFALPQQYWTRKASQLPRPSCPGHLVLSGMALHRSPHPQEHPISTKAFVSPCHRSTTCRRLSFSFCLFSLRRKRASIAPTSVTQLPTSQYASKQWGALCLVILSHKQEAEEQLNTIIQYCVLCYNVLLCFISF